MSAEALIRGGRTGEDRAGHVIVCGLRGIGLRIVEQLHRAGEPVTVLEEFADRTQLEIVIGWGVAVAAPSGSSAQTLTAAGIGTARAVVCVVDSELANLEIALVARELRPDVRVVTQLGNQAIGRAMAAGNGPGAVLDVAALAAPAIVEACLSRRVHRIPIGGETFRSPPCRWRRRPPCADLYGDLAPIAVVRPPTRRGRRRGRRLPWPGLCRPARRPRRHAGHRQADFAATRSRPAAAPARTAPAAARRPAARTAIRADGGAAGTSTPASTGRAAPCWCWSHFDHPAVDTCTTSRA